MSMISDKKTKKDKKRKVEKISKQKQVEVTTTAAAVDVHDKVEKNGDNVEVVDAEAKERERRKLKNRRNKESKKRKKSMRKEHSEEGTAEVEGVKKAKKQKRTEEEQKEQMKDDDVQKEEEEKKKKKKKEKKKKEKNEEKKKESTEEKEEEEVKVETREASAEDGGVTRFTQLDIANELKQAINETFDFGDSMTEIQRSSIPAALESSATRDIIAQASTGSGKTIAFLVPVLAQLCKENFAQNYMGKKGHIGALILSPVRELALQIQEVAEKLLDHHVMRKRFRLKSGVLVGGVSKRKDENVLQEAHLIVATPGRLADHVNSGNIDLQAMRFFVMDEADMLIDQGFEREITDIVGIMPAERATMLFSATMSDKINQLAVLSMRQNPVKIGFEKKRNVSTLIQKYVQVPADKKLASLLGILKKNQSKKIIIFVSIKKSVEFTTLLLNNLGIEAVELRGNISQNKRTETFREFSKQESGILIATDVAARGLDIPDVDLVIQVDFPEQLAQYFHRTGRTARAGKAGTAVLMLNPAEVKNTLGVLKAHLMEDINDKEEKLFEYMLPVENDELDELQQQVVDAVFLDQTLWNLASSIPRLYEMVFQMYRRRYGFRDSDFSLEAMQSSFGFGTPSPDAMSKKQQDNSGGGFNNHGRNGKFNTSGQRHGRGRVRNQW